MEASIDSQIIHLKGKAEPSMSDHEATTISAAISDPVSSEKQSEHSDESSLDRTMQVAAQDSGYNSSGSSGHHSPVGTQNGGAEEGELVRIRSRASSCTSISSIPASTLTSPAGENRRMNIREGQEYMAQPWDHHVPQLRHTIRQREGTFRKPSSVRAIQMHTEDEGDDYYHLTPPKRRGSQRTSDISIRSAGSSPFKRSPFYSSTGATAKPKIKKEYPLVLLHCTLLPPSLPVPGLIEHPKRQYILRKGLPPVYWRRWKLLEEKTGSGVIRDRGILISHPEDGYDLLEERLLESLELQHPRLDHGHFIGHDETDSDGEDRLVPEDSGTEDDGEECPDCGARVVRQNTTRKWEVKVFAANGLMRAGAWAAAWKEMEKVDVEVGLWLPPDVRAALEKRLIEYSSHMNIANGPPIALLQEPENIPVDPSVRALTTKPLKADMLSQVTQAPGGDLPPASPGVTASRSQDNQKWNQHTPKLSEDIDLRPLLANYIYILASDRRNITIVFLSILVIFFALNPRAAVYESDLRPFPTYIPEYTTSPVVSLQQPATQTWTEHTSSQTLSVAIPDPAGILASTVESAPFASSDDISTAAAGPSVTEREEVPPTETVTVSANSAEIMSGEQEEPIPSIELGRESPSGAESGDFFVEGTQLVSEVPEQSVHPRENEPDGPLQIETDSSSMGSAESGSGEQEQVTFSSESGLEKPQPTDTGDSPTENTEAVPEEQGCLAQLNESRSEESLLTAVESPSIDGIHHTPEETLLQSMETVSMTEPLSTAASINHIDADQTLPTDDKHNENEQNEQNGQNEPHEPHELHELHEPVLPNEHDDDEMHEQ
ncbi:hypothetical protein BDV09DRAFT_164758 [Aspergillus tetrazonus]